MRPSATGGLERRAQLGLGANHPHAARLRLAPRQLGGPLGERLVERQQLGGALAERRQVSLHGRRVAARDRAGERLGAALGPVRRRPEDQRREQLARILDPDPLEQLGGRLLEGDQQVGGDRGGGVVGGAPLLGHLEGAHPQALGEPLGEAEGGRARARDGARGAGQVGAAVGDRLEGVEGEGLGASLARRRPGRPARWRRSRGRRSEAAAPRRRSSRRRRRSRRRERTAGRPRLAGMLRAAWSRPASSAATPARSAAAAIDRPALPAPTTASGGSPCAAPGAAASRRFRSSSRIGDTRRLEVGSCW